MSDEEDYSSEDDEDYVPTDGEAVSEEDNSGDEEDLNLLKDDQTADEAAGGGRGKRKKAKKKATGLPTRKRTGGIRLEDEVEDKNGNKEEEESRRLLQEEIEKEKEAKKEEQTKKRADDLWASFMSDVGGKPKAKSTATSPSMCTLIKPVTSLQKPAVKPTSNPSGKITITKTFDFAGESVKVSKEVDADSKEAKQSLKEQESTTPKPAGLTGLSGMSSGSKRPGGGLGGVLDRINKKPKISVLDKSKLDWDQYKQKEGISEELNLHHKGKESYLERKAFLERSDLRQFEIEKNLRLSSSKR